MLPKNKMVPLDDSMARVLMPIPSVILEPSSGTCFLCETEFEETLTFRNSGHSTKNICMECFSSGDVNEKRWLRKLAKLLRSTPVSEWSELVI